MRGFRQRDSQATPVHGLVRGLRNSTRPTGLDLTKKSYDLLLNEFCLLPHRARTSVWQPYGYARQKQRREAASCSCLYFRYFDGGCGNWKGQICTIIGKGAFSRICTTENYIKRPVLVGFPRQARGAWYGTNAHVEVRPMCANIRSTAQNKT